MSEFKEQVIESVDAHSTITEKTEEDQTSAWDSEDPSEIESIGQGVKAKAGTSPNFTHVGKSPKTTKINFFQKNLRTSSLLEVEKNQLVALI